MQSFTVCGDGGLVLQFVVVSSTDLKWVEPVMTEIVTRHGATINKDKKVIEQGKLPSQILLTVTVVMAS